MFLSYCSTDLDRSDFLKSTNVDVRTSGGDEDEEEEITAVPPTVISGAHLACQSLVKNEDDQTLNISCHLEREGEILGNVELLESDISIENDLGEDLVLSFTDEGNGIYLFTLKLLESSNVKIALNSIGGAEFEPQEDLMSVITAEQIVDTKDISETENNSTDEQLEEQTTTTEEPAPTPAPVQTEVESAAQEEPAAETPEEQGLNCNSIGTPGTWVLVPGDPDYGTDDFCVMKYEAKCSLENGRDCRDNMNIESPASQPVGTPWVRISQLEAKAECSALGEGYHLITNPEWMTLAANATNVGENWSGAGVVGLGELARGHSDDSPSNPCAADSNDANGFVEGDCTGSDAGEFNQRRIHILSNGEVVWDLAGNVREWVDFFNKDDKPLPNTDTYNDYTSVTGTATMPLTALIPTNAVKSFWDDTWDSNQSIGKYYSGLNSNGGALIRGGDWSNGSHSGLYYTRLYSSQTSANTYKGFRCVYTKP